MWKIRGKTYNLDSYLDKHPGGRKILEACKGDDDLTASFESYHALCNMKNIEQIMVKYETGTCNNTNFTFNENGFYRTLQKRIVNYFNEHNYKANPWWAIKSLIQFGLYFITFIIAFYTDFNLWIRMLSSFMSGHLIIQFGFGVMHDASHMALSHNMKVNEFLTDFWNSLALWDSHLWTKHHVINHHAFTGDYKLDPDVIHLKPFICKNSNDSLEKYWKISQKFPKLITLFTTCIFPGMFIGQGFLYNFIWLKNEYMWNMKLSSLYNIKSWQNYIKLFVIFSFLYGLSFWVFMLYAIGSNITYFVCIMPDHDTLEIHNNSINTESSVDWGEMQVRHSGNFANQNSWVCDMFGGINYQIEHHLFPTICHVHFKEIKPIIETTCKEFNIPYSHHNTIFGAINSTLNKFSLVTCKKDI